MNSAAYADVLVRLFHLVVFLLQAFLGGRERVRVLHNEFAPAHKTVARPKLVAELILDMVKIDRELLIGAELVANQRGYRFLMRGSQNELALMTVVEANEFFSVRIDSSALTPEIGIDHNRHHELLSAM